MDLEFVGDGIRLLVVRFYPLLFLLLVIGVWYFSLWSYLDYLILILIVFILGGVALNFNWSSLGSLLFGTNGYQEIHNHAKEGDSESVKRYLERGGDPNVKAVYGVTPLHLATKAGHFETVRLLVEGGADVNQNLNDYDSMGFTPVFEAAYQNRDDIVEFLLEKGAEKDIYLSAILGDIEDIKRYAEKGGDLNASRDRETNKPYLSGKTLLHLATWRDSVSTVRYLLENGAEIDIRDVESRTPLHGAAACNSKNVAQLLIEKGADINASSRMKQTPLHFAAGISGNVEIVKILLDNGADIEARDGYGNNTPLHEAIKGNYIEAVKILITSGTDINAKGHFDRTPLGLAKHRGKREEIIDFLMDCGAK